MAKNAVPCDQPQFACSGIAGLDEILCGGFPAGHVYLIEGAPGAGKTTLGTQFLLEGVRRGEPVLYITLSETKQDLEKAAQSHGWSLDGIEFLELLTSTELLTSEAASMMFHPAETELSETSRLIVEAIERVQPKRLVLDSLSEIRLQSQTMLRYRREVLALRQFLSQRDCTALLLDELQSEITAQSVVHGIIEIHRHTPDFGPARRRIQIAKLRGVQFWEGYHDYTIRYGGLQVFPRLVAAEQGYELSLEEFPSGKPALDSLLGGGLAFGTSTLLIGPAGSGKSSMAAQYALAAARGGRRAAIFTFEETVTSYLTRCAAMGMDLQEHIRDGRVALQRVDPGELSPGQFVQIIRGAVEDQQVKVLVIDSLNGYLNAMPDERFLILQLHELVTYLNQQGVLTLLVMSQTGLVGSIESPTDASYLTDNVILFRLFEAAGEVRHAISMMKKRAGSHERTIRELRFTSSGLEIGEPLRGFQGVLTGVPVFTGNTGALFERGEG